MPGAAKLLGLGSWRPPDGELDADSSSPSPMTAPLLLGWGDLLRGQSAAQGAGTGCPLGQSAAWASFSFEASPSASARWSPHSLVSGLVQNACCLSVIVGWHELDEDTSMRHSSTLQTS
mmetsp:Transcript_112461/g.318592  ORF Transcript_112461/g.318592 Transcript_112461/m.318592 type:complete len:119 (-) Transcript_112461:52-408(-)